MQRGDINLTLFRLINDQNKPRGNNKRSFINNPYLFLATRFAYNYTYYQVISVTIFFVRKQFYQTLLKLAGAFNLRLIYEYNNCNNNKYH